MIAELSVNTHQSYRPFYDQLAAGWCVPPNTEPPQPQSAPNPSCFEFVDQLLQQFYDSSTRLSFGTWLMNRGRSNSRVVGDGTYNKWMPGGRGDPNGFRPELIKFGQSGDVYRHIMFVAGTVLAGAPATRAAFFEYDRAQARSGRRESITELEDDFAGERVGNLMNDYRRLGRDGLRDAIRNELCQ